MADNRRKRAEELTDDEVMLRVFPKAAVEQLRGIAHAQDRKPKGKEDTSQDES